MTHPFQPVAGGIAAPHAILALANGATFHGYAIGASGQTSEPVGLPGAAAPRTAKAPAVSAPRAAAGSVVKRLVKPAPARPKAAALPLKPDVAKASPARRPAVVNGDDGDWEEF